MKDDGLYIIHMQECIGRISTYTRTGRRQFFASSLIQDAVLRNLQTLGEPSKRLSKALKEIAPALAWTQIAGFRNVLVHDYLGVDLNVVWQVIVSDLPALDEFLQAATTRLGLPAPRRPRAPSRKRKKKGN